MTGLRLHSPVQLMVLQSCRLALVTTYQVILSQRHRDGRVRGAGSDRLADLHGISNTIVLSLICLNNCQALFVMFWAAQLYLSSAWMTLICCIKVREEEEEEEEEEKTPNSACYFHI